MFVAWTPLVASASKAANGYCGTGEFGDRREQPRLIEQQMKRLHHRFGIGHAEFPGEDPVVFLLSLVNVFIDAPPARFQHSGNAMQYGGIDEAREDDAMMLGEFLLLHDPFVILDDDGTAGRKLNHGRSEIKDPQGAHDRCTPWSRPEARFIQAFQETRDVDVAGP